MMVSRTQSVANPQRETGKEQAVSRTCSDVYADDPSHTFWHSKDAIFERKAGLMRHCWSYEPFRTETKARLRLMLCEKVFLMRVSATTKRRFWLEHIACVNFLATEVVFLSPPFVHENWLAIFSIGIFIHFINGWLNILVSTFSCSIKLYRFRENMRDLRSICPSREWIDVLDVKLYIYRRHPQFKWGRNVPFTRNHKTRRLKLA